MKKVIFYHSIVCPRCHLSGMMLSRALARHPKIEVTRVEFLTNIGRARADGVKSIPTLVAEGGQALSGVVLTLTAIDAFFSAIQAG